MLSIRHRLICFFTAAICVTSVGVKADESPSGKERSDSIVVYIGTYTGKKSQGIYVCRLDPATGALTKPELAGEMINPSWVTIHPNHKFLYACGEYGPFKGGSAIGAFAIKSDGTLTSLNQQPAAGGGPCYAIVDNAGKNVLVANYGTGSVADLPIATDGSLSPAGSVDQHPNTDAKQKPHAHCVDLDPDNRFAVSCDAGLDKLFVYRFDSDKGTLTANDPPTVELAPKTAPRHLVFSHDGRFAYVITEAALTVVVFTYDAEHGVFHEIQSISTVPAGLTGQGLSTAELVLHPSGKFLYGSNRGHDSIVGYAIDQSTGKLTLIGNTPTQGKSPRGFGIDPTGRWLIAGNQNSDSLVEFKIDQKTGELLATGTKYELGTPVCVKFMEAK
ncbi:MAG TPA: lactonase family protein [Tepidisphaeraceae bacterium]|jgi:6-phosphogluconolactonase|nr:lactonase family protein [Tepidisphaeraceae bacterium]